MGCAFTKTPNVSMTQQVRKGLPAAVGLLLCLSGPMQAQVSPDILQELPEELRAEYVAIRQTLQERPYEALVRSQRFLRRAQLLDHSMAQVHGYSVQTQAYIAMGLWEPAWEAGQRALALYLTQKRKRPRLLYSLHYRLGYVLQQLERYGDALEQYLAAAQQAAQLRPPDPNELVRSQNAVASVYLVLSDTARAMRWLSRAEQVLRAASVASEHRSLWSSLRAFALYRAGRIREGIVLQEQALKEAIQAQEWERAVVRYELLGWLWMEAGFPERAGAALQAGLRLTKLHTLPEGTVRLYTRLSDLALNRGRAEEAVSYALRALDWAHRFGVRGFTLWTLSMLGEAYRRSGRLQEAEFALRAACRLAEQRRHSIAGTPWAPGAFAQWQEPYRGLVRVLLAQGRLEEALLILEQTRGRYAEDLMGRRRLLARLSPKEARDLERVQDHLSDLYARRALLPPGPERDRVEEAISQAELLWTRYQRRGSLGVALSREKLQTIGRLLEEQNRLGLVYFIEPDSAWVFLLQGTSVSVRSLPTNRSRLASALSGLPWLRGAMSFHSAPLAADTLWALYRALLEPLERELSRVARLLLVPDEPLYGLPFEMLLYRPPSNRHALEDAKWALKRWAITYSPALRLLAFYQPDTLLKPSVVAFGYPDRLPARFASAGLPALPEARREVVLLKRLFERADVLTAAEATEEAFWRIATNASLLHIATHAVVDPADPSGSAILLSPTAEHDGLVQLHEILARPLRAELVVLSACNTARGPGYVGEGLLSLAYGFFASGARSLIGSLWPVDDAITAWIVGRFYMHLRSGQGRDEALRLARLDYLAQAPGIARHPFFWASFVLYGHPEPVALPPPRRTRSGLTLALAAALLLSAMGLWLWRRRVLQRPAPGR